MTVHILVEGPSERAFLDRWVARLLRSEDFRVHPHQGKGSLPANLDARPSRTARGLLDQLPAKLRGLAGSLGAGDGVLVLVDADNQVVPEVSAAITAAFAHCAPHVRSAVSVAVEETEAFYFGDLRALRNAFPDANMPLALTYVPDSICGTWELFGMVVRDGGGNKVAWAEAMGSRVTTNPARSRSPSFRALVRELLALVPPAPVREVRRPTAYVRGKGKRMR